MKVLPILWITMCESQIIIRDLLALVDVMCHYKRHTWFDILFDVNKPYSS